MVAIAPTRDTAPGVQSSVEPKLSSLAHRLERGIQVIDGRRAAGLPIDSFEVHWLRLLGEYEALYDRHVNTESTS